MHTFNLADLEEIIFSKAISRNYEHYKFKHSAVQDKILVIIMQSVNNEDLFHKRLLAYTVAILLYLMDKYTESGNRPSPIALKIV